MRTIEISGKEYTLKYAFKAAEYKECVQTMFDILSGAYVVKQGAEPKNNKEAIIGMINGVSEMVADIPNVVKITFHAGLLEEHNLSKEESYELMKQYMVENKLSYKKMLDKIKECMEEDGFFELSGLNETMEEMNQTAEEVIKEMKKPQDHKKKQTSTK